MLNNMGCMSFTSTPSFNLTRKLTITIGMSPSNIVNSISPMHNKRLAHIAGQILKSRKLKSDLYDNYTLVATYT